MHIILFTNIFTSAMFSDPCTKKTIKYFPFIIERKSLRNALVVMGICDNLYKICSLSH